MSLTGEFVRKEHFDEYAVRMDARFLSLEKRLERGFPMPRRRGDRMFFTLASVLWHQPAFGLNLPPMLFERRATWSFARFCGGRDAVACSLGDKPALEVGVVAPKT